MENYRCFLFYIYIVDFPKYLLTLSTIFVNVDFWLNFYVECRTEAEKIVDLHFARTPPPLPHSITLNEISSDN